MYFHGFIIKVLNYKLSKKKKRKEREKKGVLVNKKEGERFRFGSNRFSLIKMMADLVV